jgi:predicted regulator of Ras-like GTPase activity (Roadblock/LC7/MglB family)
VESEIERLRKKVENFPSASLYTRLAELLRAAGDQIEADTLCRRCIKEFPRSGQAYVILAEGLLAQGSKPEALVQLRSGVERDPRCYQAHFLLAEHAPDNATKEAHLRAILAFKPGDEKATAKLQSLSGSPVPPAAPTSSPVPNLKPVPGMASALPLPSTASQVLRTVATQTASSRTGTPRGAVLDALCSESGVTGAVVADSQGRVVIAKNLPAGQDDTIAAYAAEIGRSFTQAAQHAGAGANSSWAVSASGGQLLAFQREGSFTVIVLAASSVRPAMLELRARQALLDLGAA